MNDSIPIVGEVSTKYDVEYEKSALNTTGFRMDLPHSITLEGQVVAIADEIAQLTHDIEDGIRGNIISFDNFASCELVKNYLNTAQHCFTPNILILGTSIRLLWIAKIKCERGDTHSVRIQPLFWWICTAWLPLRSHTEIKLQRVLLWHESPSKTKKAGRF